MSPSRAALTKGEIWRTRGILLLIGVLLLAVGIYLLVTETDFGIVVIVIAAAFLIVGGPGDSAIGRIAGKSEEFVAQGRRADEGGDLDDPERDQPATGVRPTAAAKPAQPVTPPTTVRPDRPVPAEPSLIQALARVILRPPSDHEQLQALERVKHEWHVFEEGDRRELLDAVEQADTSDGSRESRDRRQALIRAITLMAPDARST